MCTYSNEHNLSQDDVFALFHTRDGLYVVRFHDTRNLNLFIYFIYLIFKTQKGLNKKNNRETMYLE